MATTTQLTEAENALHKLLTGTQAVEVKKPDGSTAKFTPSDEEKLRSYIKELKYDLGQTTTIRRRAIGVRFT